MSAEIFFLDLTHIENHHKNAFSEKCKKQMSDITDVTLFSSGTKRAVSK